jgi:hypothetical protein
LSRGQLKSQTDVHQGSTIVTAAQA